MIYSRQENGGYCLSCVLSARSTDVHKGKGALVETTFNKFKKMYDVCDTHAEREYHKDAVATCEAFVQVMSGGRESVIVQLRDRARETIQNDRKKVCSIVKTIILCGWQNIAFRGHCDSSTDFEGPQSDSTNHGNFGLCSTSGSLQETLT